MFMKKLLVIHNGYPLRGDGGDKVRTLNMINSLKSMGFDVSFLAFFKKDFLSLEVEKRKLPRGVKSYFIYTFPDRLGLGGLAALFRAWITSILVKSKKIEIIHLETSLSASCVKFLNKDIPVVVDFHADPVPELKMNRESHAVINRAKKDVCYALSRSQCLIAVSNNLADNLKSYYNYEALVSILPCSFNNEHFQVDLKESSDLRKKLSLEGRIVLCYLGGLHKWQCIEETLDIFIRLLKKDPRYFLCLYTNGDRKSVV